jgi:cation transport protein ChaC
MNDALRTWRVGEDVWVFGYGSLIWRPEFDFVERRLALLRGHHRALCLWSRVNRGTPETPGLVFGLDRGGACRGVVYRLAGAQVPTFFPQLWDREMPTGAYGARWINCATPAGAVRALVFVMDRHNPLMCPPLPRDELLAIVRRTRGRYGSCIDYVTETDTALHQAGIQDRRLQVIAQALRMPATEHLLD